MRIQLSGARALQCLGTLNIIHFIVKVVSRDFEDSLKTGGYQSYRYERGGGRRVKGGLTPPTLNARA